MSFLAQRLHAIKPSPTLAMTSRVKELRADGRTIIDLSAGEPDFDTPYFVQEAAIFAIRNGQTRYTPVDGTRELKEAIAAKFARENGLIYAPNQIIVGAGGKQVLYNALMASLNVGDEVIIPAPYWVSYYDMVLLGGGIAKVVECPADAGFKITPAQLEAAIMPNTKWFILNSPSNPTGAAYSVQDLKALAEVLLRYPHVHLISDDIYEHIRYDDMPFFTIAQVEPRLYDRTITINGVSKAYAMTGWRIGYAGGPKSLIAAMSMMQSQSTSNPCSISQAAAVAALNGDQSFLQERNAAFQKRRDVVVEMLNTAQGIACQTPQGAFYVYPSCAGAMGKRTPQGQILKTDEDFVTYLLDTQNVACVHGAAFGLSPYFRISTATSLESLKDACYRIQNACAVLKD